MRTFRCGALFSLLVSLSGLAQTPAKRVLNLDDLNRLRYVGDPQCSPDGRWVAYTVAQVDNEKDKRVTQIWMASWDGSEDIQLTYGTESESTPRWSPDGRYLSFVSSRDGQTKGSQVWLLDRRGGEARQLTHIKDHSISEYAWSPDSKKLLLVLQEKNDADKDDAKQKSKDGEEKPPKPIAIDRYHFKEDIEGYLGPKHNHIYLFDIATGKLDQITNDNFDETSAQFSPDGTKIAFVSNQDKDPDRSKNTDVFVIDARPGAAARRLTTFPGPDAGPLAWSPDGKLIAYLQGSESKYDAYNLDRLAEVPSDGGPARILTEQLDRGVSDPVFNQDGSSILFIVADDRSEYPAQVPAAGGPVQRLISDPVVASKISSRTGHSAVLVTTDYAPNEVYALEGDKLRQITHHNDALLSELNLAHVEPVSFKSKDGTDVHGLVFEPPNFERGKKYPALLRIHGGPNGQDGHDFDFDRQFLAAHGYVVLAVNYRGSSGRGQEYQKTIFADWGNKEVADLLAGVDHMVSMGIADPDRLGIGGWSYGGILTDYTIASDQRFKGAISGAGSANQISMYGADEYVFQYDSELGPPWKSQNLWIKLSYPFFHADRIHTPTLFMGGDKDFNVPLIGSEQMYQALKTLGVPTELVIYPGQFHGFTRPSFVRDRYERYVAWYDKYVKNAAASSENATAAASSGKR